MNLYKLNDYTQYMVTAMVTANIVATDVILLTLIA